MEGIIEVSGVYADAHTFTHTYIRVDSRACTLTSVEERGMAVEEKVDGDMRGHSFEERGWPTHAYANHIRRCTGF